MKRFGWTLRELWEWPMKKQMTVISRNVVSGGEESTTFKG